jgi:O-antigen/teichoic acid export membrane protein
MSGRIGLSFTAPFIGALIVSPQFFLSLLGRQYLPAETALLVLAIGIFPFSIVVNGISKFNYSGELIKILLIGSVQVSVFVAAFLFLVSEYRILGVAFSVLVAYATSSVFVIIWSERRLRIYIAHFGISILIGSVSGYLLGLLSPNGFSNVVPMVSSICIIIAINIILKNTTPAEIKQLLELVTNRK